MVDRPRGCSIDDGVADVRGHHVGSEDFERDLRIFDGLNGIAAIEVGADEILAGFFDQHAGFASLHVAGVVLDGDLDAQVQGLDRTLRIP